MKQRNIQYVIVLHIVYYFILFKMNDIRDRIKKVRVAAGLNQIEFIAKCNINQSAYNHIETKKREASLSLIQIVSKNFNVSYDWLIDGVGTMYKDPKIKLETIKPEPLQSIADNMERLVSILEKKQNI